jgi:hypothetical protein
MVLKVQSGAFKPAPIGRTPLILKSASQVMPKSCGGVWTPQTALFRQTGRESY